MGIVAASERQIVWIGASRRDLREFPRQVRRDIGQALYAAQQGETDPSAKPLRGFGGGAVLETSRTTAATRGVVSIRSAIPKPSTCCTLSRRNRRAASRRRSEISISSTSVWQRLNDSIDRGKIDMATKRTMPVRAEKSSGNVFTDLGLPHSEQELLKAKLTLQIYRLIKKRDLTQVEAGKILGIKQPHVSLLMRNRSGSFSVERLMEFLTALGQDIEISVTPARRGQGEVSVV